MVEAVVVGILMNPFGKPLRAEYRYRTAYTEACHPIAPLIDDLYFESQGLLLIPDIYSVWPDAGVFPRASSYREVFDGVLAAVERRCNFILPPRLCKRVSFRVVPWIGNWGEWKFNASYDDTVVFSFYHILSELLKWRPERLQVVLSADSPPALLGMALYEAALAAAKAFQNLEGVQLRLEVLASDPYPYPWTRRKAPLLDLRDVASLLDLKFGRVHERCKPLHVKVRTPESAAFEKRIPRLRRPSSARDLAAMLRDLIEAYIEFTLIKKEKVGGHVVHALAFDFPCLLSVVRSNAESA